MLNAGFIGLARTCLEEAVKQARQRKTFGKELYQRQGLSFHSPKSPPKSTPPAG